MDQCRHCHSIKALPFPSLPLLQSPLLLPECPLSLQSSSAFRTQLNLHLLQEAFPDDHSPQASLLSASSSVPYAAHPHRDTAFCPVPCWEICSPLLESKLPQGQNWATSSSQFVLSWHRAGHTGRGSKEGTVGLFHPWPTLATEVCVTVCPWPAKLPVSKATAVGQVLRDS